MPHQDEDEDDDPPSSLTPSSQAHVSAAGVRVANVVFSTASVAPPPPDILRESVQSPTEFFSLGDFDQSSTRLCSNGEVEEIKKRKQIK